MAMKKYGIIAAAAFMVCISVLLSQGHGYTISLTRNYVEHYTSAAFVSLTTDITETSYTIPYAQARVGGSGASYTYNGRGFADDIIRNNYRLDIDVAWSEAVIRFYGESGYSIPAGFGNVAQGTSLSKVRYDLSLIPSYGQSGAAEIVFSIRRYENNYGDEYALQRIQLKDKYDQSVFAWEGKDGLKEYALNLNPLEQYGIWIESHGDFDSLGRSEGFYASHVEMLLTVQEMTYVPIPSSLLLFGSSLVFWLVWRRKAMAST
jgi:hypothetical protein